MNFNLKDEITLFFTILYEKIFRTVEMTTMKKISQSLYLKALVEVEIAWGQMTRLLLLLLPQRLLVMSPLLRSLLTNHNQLQNSDFDLPMENSLFKVFSYFGR